MKVLYLFNRARDPLVSKAKSGEIHDGLFLGMLRLPHYGIEASHIEIERYLPQSAVKFLRKHINIYYIHLPLYWKFFSYDFVFTSTAFGSQLLNTFLRSVFFIKKPRWVMLDYSITGFLGNGATLRQKMFSYMVRRAAGIVTIGEQEAALLKQKFPERSNRIEFIHYGVDADFFKPAAINTPVSRGVKILAVGFDRGRDYAVLFDACARCRQDFPELSLLIATRADRLKKFQPLPSYVSAREFSPKEMADQYSQADIVAAPLDIRGGFNDAMGCSTIVEGMAMGKAVVATRTPTTESYIASGENGVLVPPLDPQALARAISSLAGNPDMRKKIGDAARARALSDFSADIVTEKLAQFLKKIEKLPG